ncbi:flagellar filament capping protein FliD [Vibrio barjaei]|uniref:flagellar filament capping protein FliD n=1 Tax=Vibrio barjaei TaxID=1676683 RepID=UPI0022846698|nr:flagellar filament capping protein FliD [Vibrio barjaei]MCY9872299.1 flagellar filament capping protein FliD [Vibrio barjaei]
MQVDAASMADQFAYLMIQDAEFKYSNLIDKTNTNRSAFSELKTMLGDLDGIISDFHGFGKTISESQVTYDDDAPFTAVADGNVLDVDLEIYVEQMATRKQYITDSGVTSTSSTLFTNGTLELEIGGVAQNVNLLEFDDSGDGNVSLSEFVSGFNSKFSDSVTATLISTSDGYSVMYSSKEAGQDNDFDLSFNTGTDYDAINSAANMSPVEQSSDATIRVGGINGALVQSSSNSFDDVIPGLSITISKLSDGSASRLQVGSDKEGVETNVKSVLDSINSIIDYINNSSTSDPDTGFRGALAGDSMVRGLKSSLQSLLTGTYNGVSLRDMGFELERSGKLVLDDDKFNEYLGANDITESMEGPGGLLESIESLVDDYRGFDGGYITDRIDSYDRSLDRYNDSLESLERKYNMYYQRYLADFTRMNSISQQMESTMASFGTY